ncbi:zinc finger and BTB domain-containing protein 41 [Drosophila novamexicana]|uniref:zinc finger and BTB domain-containing protein 41 n=1 Tax=Drosophila novamexicana TaxID=47314 RepID=UPI0011E59D3C|nr:zinc finger and BTB domain-containing protein 41 [Drosophila novamexicana]
MAAAADAAKSNALLAMNKVNNTKCRACLSVSRQTVKLDAKIPDLKNARTYGQGLRQCTNMPLTARSPGGYRWPMQICVRCCRALEVAMHFVELALESNRKLFAESQSPKLMTPAQSTTSAGELKRKASSELLHWNQFSQQFEQFVESYDGVPGPIEENVLYMRGAKVPRLDTDIALNNEPPKEDDVILFDVKYDSNDQDEEDENDGSDAKNSETFYDNSINMNDSNIADKSSENNNNYNFNNKNGDISGLPNVESDLIQRALFMTLNDDGNGSQTAEELQSIESIKATLLKSTEGLTGSSASTPKTTPSKDVNVNIPILSCSICKHTHTEAKQMRSHYMRVHNCDVPEDDIIGLTKNQSFKCRPCNGYVTNSRTDMQQHLIEHHKIDGDFEMYCYVQQNCPACGRIFKDQRSARTHYTRMHTPQQPQQLQPGGSGSVCGGAEITEQQFVCTACDKVFNMKGSLQAHQRFCQVKQPVHCNFCELQFSSMRKYELHLQQQHAVDTLHECEICMKSFKNSESLSVHRKRHSERHYQCAKCSLNYINAAELRVHYERAHVHEEEVVSCRICGSKFQNYALLREHEQRNHQKSKIWRCDNCNFETNSRARLRQHQYEHTDYPYKCKHCPEEFADRGKMRQHSKKMHAVELTDEQLAEMFRERIGYTNRHDAFSKTNNSLEIPGFSDECFTELKSLGMDYDDITTDLFSNSISSTLDNLLELVP